MACPSCFTGFTRTDKEPIGQTSTIHNLPTYIARPPPTTPPKGIIVIIPDAFGWQFKNNRLLADTYATAGFLVYLPDFMAGSSAPVYFLDTMERLTSTSSLTDWLYKPYDLFWAVWGIVPFMWRNLPATSHPRVVEFLEKLRTGPVDGHEGLKVGVAGFCWGGKHVVMLAQRKEAHLIDAVFTAHPGWWKVPGEVEGVTRPLSLAIGDRDEWLKMEEVRVVERVLMGLEGVECEVVVYPGAKHGFSVRIDRGNSRLVEQSEQAERQAVRWFERMLV